MFHCSKPSVLPRETFNDVKNHSFPPGMHVCSPIRQGVSPGDGNKPDQKRHCSCTVHSTEVTGLIFLGGTRLVIFQGF